MLPIYTRLLLRDGVSCEAKIQRSSMRVLSVLRTMFPFPDRVKSGRKSRGLIAPSWLSTSTAWGLMRSWKCDSGGKKGFEGSR